MTKSYRILLVEDDHCIRNLMEEILLDEGYHLTSVPNGQEAVNTLADKDFHLLITDYRMPHLNGVELLQWCRINQPNLPVIFMTATTQVGQEVEIPLEDLAATMIHKPLNLETFLNTVKTSLTYVS